MEYALKFQYKTTNNEAKYEVIIAGLQLCKTLEAKYVSLNNDSNLVVDQILRKYEAREVIMVKYLVKCKELISEFESF